MSYWEEIKNANGHMSDQQKNIFKVIGALLALLLLKKVYDNPRILIMVGVLIISVMLHEIAHGFAAYLYGDDTAKNAGRLTLNPLKHIDIAGIMLPMFLILTGSQFVIGWAKPVPINMYKVKNKKDGLFAISIAGILVNLALAFIGATILKFVPITVFRENPYFYSAVQYLISLNVTLAIFNLLPIPPLDGSKVLMSFGNRKINNFLLNIERFGLFILILLMWTGLLTTLMSPFYKIVYGALNTYIQF